MQMMIMARLMMTCDELSARKVCYMGRLHRNGQQSGNEGSLPACERHTGTMFGP